MRDGITTTHERTALVTGASSGIGLAIARALGESAYRLTLCSNRETELHTAVENLRKDGIDTQGTVVDLSEEESAIDVVGFHRARFGRLDVLVNNAGIALAARIEEIGTARLDAALAINLRAVVLVTREALPMLRAAGATHGKALIVNTASIAGTVGRPGLSVYAATKAAVINLSQSTSREVGGVGVQCTALAPGLVDTPMVAGIAGRASANLIKPADVAEAVLFLLRTSPNCHVPEIVFTQAGRRDL